MTEKQTKKTKLADLSDADRTALKRELLAGLLEDETPALDIETIKGMSTDEYLASKTAVDEFLANYDPSAPAPEDDAA